MSTVDKELLRGPFILRSIRVFACQKSLISLICLPQSLSWSQVSTGHLQPVDFATLFCSSEGGGQKSILIPNDSVSGVCVWGECS